VEVVEVVEVVELLAHAHPRIEGRPQKSRAKRRAISKRETLRMFNGEAVAELAAEKELQREKAIKEVS